MTGLDKIVAEIRDEAAAEARQTLAEAKAKADEILSKAAAESDAKTAKIAEGARTDVAEIERSRDSAAVLQRRQRTLGKKQELLAETLEKARQSLYTLPEDKYFDLLVRLAANVAQPGEGALVLNEKDKARAPKDFEAKLKAALPAGAALTLSGDTAPIDGGFVVKYGDVEENCSFAAMFEARADEFSDLVQGTLFGE